MLKLVKNNITDEGFRILLSYLINDTYTKVLNVTSNHLTQKSLTYILALIGHNNILKTIYISNNKINSMQLKRVQKELESKLVQVVLWLFVKERNDGDWVKAEIFYDFFQI